MHPRIVIKIGTGVLTKEDGHLNRDSLWNLVNVVSKLQIEGYSCVLVSSGAVGAGVEAFGLKSYPNDLATKQACAAVGQSRLMQVYQNLFEKYGLNVAQILLSGINLSNPEQTQLVTNTLTRLTDERAVIPIINENDVVTVEELTFGDNDQLSVRVAEILQADQLFLLTSTDGLYPPNSNVILEEVSNINEVLGYADGSSGKFSTGGMSSKLQAVKKAVHAGVESYIINGEHPERIAEFLSTNSSIGTKFLAKTQKQSQNLPSHSSRSN